MTILPCPPHDWKRPPMPLGVKLAVVLRQTAPSKLKSLAKTMAGGALAKMKLLMAETRCSQTGDAIGDYDNVRFDHRPAIWERMFDTDKCDTIPPANDPSSIEAVSIAGHDVRTHGAGGEKRVTTVGSDSHRRAKIKRFEDAFAGKRPPKPKSNFKSRSLPKGRKFPKRAGAT